jgi:hypothetical protein
MRCCKAVFAILLLLPAAACSYSHPAGVAETPNPLPPPGYRAVCGSTPLPFNAYQTRCEPGVGAEERVVVRAKG